MKGKDMDGGKVGLAKLFCLHKKLCSGKWILLLLYIDDRVLNIAGGSDERRQWQERRKRRRRWDLCCLGPRRLDLQTDMRGSRINDFRKHYCGAKILFITCYRFIHKMSCLMNVSL